MTIETVNEAPEGGYYVRVKGNPGYSENQFWEELLDIIQNRFPGTWKFDKDKQRIYRGHKLDPEIYIQPSKYTRFEKLSRSMDGSIHLDCLWS